MSVRTTCVAMAAGMALLGAAQPAFATGPLPWCFSVLPLGDQFILWPTKTGGGQRDGSGFDIAGSRSMSVSTSTQGGTLTIGYTIYPQPGYDPVTGGGTVNIATGSGPGECFAPGLFDCGAFTFQRITCPSPTARLAAASEQGDGQALSCSSSGNYRPEPLRLMVN